MKVRISFDDEITIKVRKSIIKIPYENHQNATKIVLDGITDLADSVEFPNPLGVKTGNSESQTKKRLRTAQVIRTLLRELEIETEDYEPPADYYVETEDDFQSFNEERVILNYADFIQDTLGLPDLLVLPTLIELKSRNDVKRINKPLNSLETTQKILNTVLDSFEDIYALALIGAFYTGDDIIKHYDLFVSFGRSLLKKVIKDTSTRYVTVYSSSGDWKLPQPKHEKPKEGSVGIIAFMPLVPLGKYEFKEIQEADIFKTIHNLDRYLERQLGMHVSVYPGPLPAINIPDFLDTLQTTINTILPSNDATYH